MAAAGAGGAAVSAAASSKDEHHPADEQDMPLPYVHEASKRGHADQVKDCLTEDKSVVNSTDSMDNTPLLWAVMGDHVECVKLLIEAGADVLHLNRNKDSALHRAAWRGATKSLPVLLEAGADKLKDAKNNDDKLPVDLARTIEIKEIVAPAVQGSDGEDYDFDESDDGEPSDDEE